MKTEEKGFLLLEALLAILIVSLFLAAALGAIAGALRLSAKTEVETEATLAFEDLLFQLETGERLDLVRAGGQGEWRERYDYEITSSQDAPEVPHRITAQLSRKGGEELLLQELLLEEGVLG